ncbi:MAG: YCF48-related protein [bacterium]
MRQMAILLFALLSGVGASSGLNYHGVAVAPNGFDAWVVTIETVAVYRTTDFGASWNHQEILTVRDFFDVEFVDENRGWTCGRIGTIYHTTNGGADWTRQSLGGPKFSTRIRFLDPDHGWVASGEAIVLKTTDGGEFWEMLFTPNPPFPSDTVDFQGVWFVHPDTGWLVAGRWPEGDTFAGGQGYIARTTDNCASWELQRRDDSLDFYDVHFFDSREGVVVGGNDRTRQAAVLRTEDGGASWSSVAVPAGASFLRGVAFRGDHGWAVGRSGTIIHSSDRGRSWLDQSVPIDTTLFDVDFADSLRGMAAGNSVVVATVDGGASWGRVFGGVNESPPAPAPPGVRLRARYEGSGLRLAVAGVRGVWTVAVYDPAGRRKALVAGQGEGEASTKADLARGVYLARLESAEGGDIARFNVLTPERGR